MSRRNARNIGDADRLLGQFTALGDVVRLRMLHLLADEELSVGELARIVQVPQSTASRHLKPLLDGGWIARRSDGTAGLYCMANITMPDDSKALREVARALKANGRLFIVDMVAHDRRAYAASMGHVHLGFSADTIRRLAKVAGFELRRYRLLASDPVATGPGVFTALLVRKPH